MQWPRDEALRTNLARAGIARLLLVAQDADPPEVIGVNEDWIRVPADERDIVHRAQRLSQWVAHLASERLVIDANRIAHRGGAAVVLGELEAALLRLLMNDHGLVSRESLETSLWPDGAPSQRSLDNLVFRLRGHLEHLGVAVRSARGRGFLIEVDDVAGGHPHHGPAA
ncbi:MAG TPA: helix-turn-helix domain-containing protein [Ilumatobacteraceae bacterium]